MLILSSIYLFIEYLYSTHSRLSTRGALCAGLHDVKCHYEGMFSIIIIIIISNVTGSDRLIRSALNRTH